MKPHRNFIKKDGYIKNQNKQLRKFHINMLIKITIVALPFLFSLAFLWGIVSINPPPEKWEQTQVTFSSIYRRNVSKGSVYILNTVNSGEYILPITTEKFDSLSQQLISNKQYNVVYSQNSFHRIAQSLSSDNQEFIKLDEALSEWNKERQTVYIATIIILFLMVIGIILCLIFWCKKEHQQVKKVKSKIENRLSKYKSDIINT